MKISLSKIIDDDNDNDDDDNHFVRNSVNFQDDPENITKYDNTTISCHFTSLIFI